MVIFNSKRLVYQRVPNIEKSKWQHLTQFQYASCRWHVDLGNNDVFLRRVLLGVVMTMTVRCFTNNSRMPTF